MPRVVAKLNDRQVKAIKSDGAHACGDGLYLVVDGTARRWLFRYSSAGKRREMGMGSASDVALKEAREAVDEAKRLIRSGLDPVEARRVEKPIIPTFGAFADKLVATLEKSFKNEKHRYQWKMTLGDAYCASIRSKRVDEITTADVLEVLSPIWQEKAETASKLRGRIEKVLDAAKARGFRSGENPAAWRGHLASLLPKRQKLQYGHRPALAYDAVPAFVERLRAREAVAASALEFLILTATRASEVFGATWGEIDTSAKVWTIPAARMKMGKEHRVPLTARALAILKAMAKLRRKDGDASAHVFPGARKDRPLSNMAFKQLLVRMGETGFVPHGFRSSFRDWCGECTPFPREVAEAALAHSVGNAVELAYRRGDALEKRRKLMDAWAGFIEPKAANVVTLKPLRKTPVS